MSESEFVLAIEIGSSHIAVATARLTQSEQAEGALHEGPRSHRRAPAIAYLAHDDTLLFGEEAARRAAEEPERAVTRFGHRLGDDTPFVIDGYALSAEFLYAKAVSWAIDSVTETEGAAPVALTLTHPAHWGEHRLTTLRDELNRQGIAEVALIPAAKAAAMQLDVSHPIEPGETVAVYDLGAETVECVVLRKRHDGRFDIIGEAVHIDNIGGAGFDDAVLEHVIAAAASDLARFAPHRDASHLRDTVRAAKEALSSHPDATITIPVAATSVRITRAEFEDMIVDDVDRSLGALTQAVESAAITPGALRAIVLAGGSTHIPLIAQRLSDRFTCPAVLDVAPEAAAVRGAARTKLAELRAQQVSVTGADSEVDEFTDDPRSFSPELIDASPAPVSALRRALFIFFAIVATVMAGAIVLGGAAAVGGTRSDLSGGATRSSDALTRNPTPTPSTSAITQPAYPPPPPTRDPTRTEPIPPAQELSGADMD
ncbi:Hsp70 family protein [Conyzicola nivalis]|uniref:Molecular chaperone DnaK n=1 Tax=Conyzicola nivalis TaxID=1477021 RepID=A0A916SE98_9MICO|nr:Hsp70 family protein [Conyzicola nivalis]GGA94990.1 molecular chaperone DnaK [Conyzicola nivalis]